MILVGDVFDRLADLEPGSVDCIITSPPYYQQRTYSNHPHEIGREPTAADYITSLSLVGELLFHTLADTGTFWLNIGDSYSDDGLLLIPSRTVQDYQARGWKIRADIIWRKTRYMPNGGRNRPILIHEHVFMLTKRNSGYYYDPDANRSPHSPISLKRWESSEVAALGAPSSMGHKEADGHYKTKKVIPNPLGKLDVSVWDIAHGGEIEIFDGTVWDICPSNAKGAHFAIMPEQLATKCLLASSRPGDTVLDPFAGHGTTGVVAKRHGREFIGIELVEQYAVDAEARIAKEIA